MKITSTSGSSSGWVDTLVDKIYNFIFGYIDSLFDDANYEKEESTIPKSQVKPPKGKIDVDGEEVEADEAEPEVAGDSTVYTFTPALLSEKRETEATAVEADLDSFEVKVTPCILYGSPGYVQIDVTNITTGTSSRPKFVKADNQADIQKAVETSKKEVSATVKLALTKITSSSGSSIKLQNIYSNYDVPLTCEDVVQILNNESFIASMPEGESVYRIDSYDDGYEVKELETRRFTNSMYAVALDCCAKTIARIYELSWVAKGIDYNNFKNICETLSFNIQYNLTELAKLCIIHGVAPAFEVKSSDASYAIDKWQSLKDCVCGYIASLQLLALSCTDDERNMIESWIRQLNDIILYQWDCLHPAKV